MAVDLRHEFGRPLALILAALAALGWMLFCLSSWSTASVQKAQRMQIMEATERNEKLAADLARQMAAAGALADLEAKVASIRDDLTRVAQAKSDAQAELTNAQRSLTAVRRDLSEAERNVQTAKLGDLDANAAEPAAAAPDPVPTTGARAVRRGGGGYSRWTRRGRVSRSYSVRSR